MKELYILWTNADVTTSKLMVFMYAGNALKNEWWEKVTLIIWGATAKLCMEDAAIRDDIEKLIESGVDVIACTACADALGATPILKEIGVTVDYLGIALTDIIKDKSKHLITV